MPSRPEPATRGSQHLDNRIPPPPAQSPHDQTQVPVGSLDDGTPYFAPLGELVYDADSDRVQCHLCGRWFRHLTWSHLYRRHGWNKDDYVRAFGLNLHRPLHTPTLSVLKSDALKARMATDARIQRAMATVIAIARDPSARKKLPRQPYRSLEHRRKSGHGTAVHHTERRGQEEEQLARRYGFDDFNAYIRARREQHWTVLQIARELGRTDWWVANALERLEGSRTLGREEFREVKAALARRNHRERTGRARRHVEDRAGALGFEVFLDYLLDRRLRGWGQTRIAAELQVGSRRALRLLQAEGLWIPLSARSRKHPSDGSDGADGTPLGRAGHLIRTQREALGLSLSQLGEKVGLSVALLYYIEHGEKRIPIDAWQKVRKVLQIVDRLPRQLWAVEAGTGTDEVEMRLKCYCDTFNGSGLAGLLEETGCSVDDARLRLPLLLADARVGRWRLR